MISQLPLPIKPDEFKLNWPTDDHGLKVAIGVDEAGPDSSLQLGLTWIQPGTEQDSWTADDDTHEAYYVINGSVKLSWLDPEAGESVVAAGECFYFPPGRRYTIENVGKDEAFLVWVLSPSPSSK